MSRRPPLLPIRIPIPTRWITPILSSSRIGWVRLGSLASRHRSSSCRGSIFSTMALATASGTVLPVVLAQGSAMVSLPAMAAVAVGIARAFEPETAG